MEVKPLEVCRGGYGSAVGLAEVGREMRWEDLWELQRPCSHLRRGGNASGVAGAESPGCHATVVLFGNSLVGDSARLSGYTSLSVGNKQ
jgi:hypothetical protein